MKKKSSESSQLVDQLAQTAHEMIDRVHERATKMEEDIGKQSTEKAKSAMAGIEREVGNLEKYIEENPMMAAAIAFGIGAFASRVLKTVTAPPASSEATEEAGISEAA